MLESPARKDNGFSMLELLVVVAFLGIVSVIAVTNLKTLESPLANAGFTTGHYLRLVRAQAISTTSYIRLDPTSSTQLTASNVTTSDCSGTTTAITDLIYNYESGITLSATDWYICFTPRGLSDEHVTFSFSDTTGTKTVQVALGGGVKVE